MRYKCFFSALSLVFCLMALADSATEEEFQDDANLIGVQIPWTPLPALRESAETPRPEEIWMPDEESLPRAFSAEVLNTAGMGKRVLMRGMSGEDVMLLQKRLHDLGYLDGEADGRYGRLTMQAVEEFQRQNGLIKVDGKAGSETLNHLFSTDAVALEPLTADPAAGTVSEPAPTPSPFVQIKSSPTPVPDLSVLPFSAEMAEVYLGEASYTLPIVKEGEALCYPLAGIMMGLGFSCAIQDGSWMFQAPAREAILILGNDDKAGRMEYIMGSIGGILFSEEMTVYTGQGEIWVPSRLLRRLGFCVVETKDISVIWNP